MTETNWPTWPLEIPSWLQRLERERETEARHHRPRSRRRFVGETWEFQCLLSQASTVLLTTPSPPSSSHWFAPFLFLYAIVECCILLVTYDCFWFFLIWVSSDDVNASSIWAYRQHFSLWWTISFRWITLDLTWVSTKSLKPHLSL